MLLYIYKLINIKKFMQNGKQRTTAALLALFLGGIGTHRLYLGQTGTFVIMLLFCWTFIPAFIAFIDFIRYLCMSDDKFDKLYNGVSR